MKGYTLAGVMELGLAVAGIRLDAVVDAVWSAVELS